MFLHYIKNNYLKKYYFNIFINKKYLKNNQHYTLEYFHSESQLLDRYN
jgi:hypothetical protein